LPPLVDFGAISDFRDFQKGAVWGAFSGRSQMGAGQMGVDGANETNHILIADAGCIQSLNDLALAMLT
jgi:hypothetical protein